MENDPAARRFWLLQLVRIVGIVLTVVGAMTLAGNTDLPEALGVVLLVAGVAGFFFVPAIVARRWKDRAG